MTSSRGDCTTSRIRLQKPPTSCSGSPEVLQENSGRRDTLGPGVNTRGSFTIFISKEVDAVLADLEVSRIVWTVFKFVSFFKLKGSQTHNLYISCSHQYHQNHVSIRITWQEAQTSTQKGSLIFPYSSFARYSLLVSTRVYAQKHEGKLYWFSTPLLNDTCTLQFYFHPSLLYTIVHFSIIGKTPEMELMISSPNIQKDFFCISLFVIAVGSKTLGPVNPQSRIFMLYAQYGLSEDVRLVTFMYVSQAGKRKGRTSMLIGR